MDIYFAKGGCFFQDKISHFHFSYRSKFYLRKQCLGLQNICKEFLFRQIKLKSTRLSVKLQSNSPLIDATLTQSHALKNYYLFHHIQTIHFNMFDVNFRIVRFICSL